MVRELGFQVTFAAESFEPESGQRAYATGTLMPRGRRADIRTGMITRTMAMVTDHEHEHRRAPQASSRTAVNDLLSVVRDPDRRPCRIWRCCGCCSSRVRPCRSALCLLARPGTSDSARWVKDETTAAHWIAGLVTEVLPRLDLPVLAESYAAWALPDLARVKQLSAFLHACRESRELGAEDRHLGAALARVLPAWA